MATAKKPRPAENKALRGAPENKAPAVAPAVPPQDTPLQDVPSQDVSTPDQPAADTPPAPAKTLPRGGFGFIPTPPEG